MNPKITYPKGAPHLAVLIDCDSRRMDAGGPVCYCGAVRILDARPGEILCRDDGGRRKIGAPLPLVDFEITRERDWAVEPPENRGIPPEIAGVLLGIAAKHRKIETEISGDTVKVSRKAVDAERFNHWLFVAAWCWPRWQRDGLTMLDRWEIMQGHGYAGTADSFTEVCRKHGLKRGNKRRLKFTV